MGSSECLVMAKPVGPRCNLRCRYCYYLAKESLFPQGSHRMEPDLLESFVRQRFEASQGPTTHFEWHGGEPTLAGLDFFRTVVRLQKRHCPPGRTWTNGLQTNGLKIDDEWASFLADAGFTVGLSLDGDTVHHGLRVKSGGEKSHASTVQAWTRLRARGVFVNVLCVVHAENVLDPDGVYGFFRSIGATYLQFLPLVLPDDRQLALAAEPEQIGAFFCKIFDLWLAHDVGAVVVQTFDEALRPHYGAPHSLCIHRETCGDVLVLEHDGGLYACDHFVDAQHHLGNLRDLDLKAVTIDPRLVAFGQAKKEAVAPVCRSCDVWESCHGGCPKDRDASGLNRLCSAYQAFFRHSRQGLIALAAHMKAGKPLRAFRMPVG